MAVVEKGSH